MKGEACIEIDIYLLETGEQTAGIIPEKVYKTRRGYRMVRAERTAWEWLPFQSSLGQVSCFSRDRHDLYKGSLTQVIWKATPKNHLMKEQSNPGKYRPGKFRHQKPGS